MNSSRPFVISNPRSSKPGWRLLCWGAALTGLGMCSGVLAAAGVYTSFSQDLPRLDRFDRMAAVGVTRFEAPDGSLIGERYQEQRHAVSWEDVPRELPLAFLAAEDARFFEHSGLDFRGIARAALTNLAQGGAREGASTITQQLAKILVGNRRVMSRKVKEAILARRLEDVYTKEQLLTWYMNIIYLGHSSYGVKAAAQNFFRKELSELSLAEIAIIAGCAQSPSVANPWVNLEAAKRRMAHILSNMERYGWISAKEREEAMAFQFKVYPLRDLWSNQAPDYANAALKAGNRFNDGETQWLERGLTLNLALDLGAQRVAQAALDDALTELQKRQGYPGPLAHLDAANYADFFSKNAPYVASASANPDDSSTLKEGSRLLALVQQVDKDKATLAFQADLSATLPLANARWATPWTKRKPGEERSREAKFSFDGKLKDLSQALTVGDVVMVRIVAPPKPPKPQRSRNKKKSQEQAPPPETLAQGLFVELEPIPMMEGALASVSLASERLEAFAGSWDYDRSQVDRTQAVRQAGSTMKAITYARAYDLGLPPSTLISGAPYAEGAYNPTGTKTRDDKIAWVALAESENSVSLRIFDYVREKAPIESWAEWGKSLGLTVPLEGFTSEVLGANQTLRGILSAFSAFAHEGLHVEQRLFRKVVDREGIVLERALRPIDSHLSTRDTLVRFIDTFGQQAQAAMSPQTAYLITRNLNAGVTLKTGTGRRALQLRHEAAGKTGTLPYDVWFAGMSAERAAVVWLGADNYERPLGVSERDNRIYGSNTALPAWVDFMAALSPTTRQTQPKVLTPVVPKGIEHVAIDAETGLLSPLDEQGNPAKTALKIPHLVGTTPRDYAPTVVQDSGIPDLPPSDY